MICRCRACAPRRKVQATLVWRLRAVELTPETLRGLGLIIRSQYGGPDRFGECGGSTTSIQCAISGGGLLEQR